MTGRALFTAALLLAGCHDDFDAPDMPGGGIPNANISIGELCGAYRGETVGISQDLVIAGRVTSSDREGNFRYSFTVEDATGAVEIMARIPDLHNAYPEGCRVAVSLEGLALGERLSVKQIGMMPAEYGYYPTDYIPSRQELDLHVHRAWDGGGVRPAECAVGELHTGMCGRLVRIRGLHPADGGDGTWQEYTLFSDGSGGRIAVFASGYASFFGHAVPEGDLSLTGILQYGRVGDEGDMFIIKMRHEADCTH